MRDRMLALLACAAIGGCVQSSSFQCDAGSDCLLNGVAGSCEGTGFCSFPDASCDSGRRYGEHAGNGLGGTCVDDAGTTGVADSGTDGPMTTLTTTVSTTTSSETMPLDDDSSSSSAGATSLVDDGDSSTTTDTTGHATEPGTTTETTPSCETFVDAFEDDVIDPFWTQFEEMSLVESEGELRMHLTAAVDMAYPGVRRYDVDLQDGWVRMEPGALPGQETARLFLAVGADDSFTDVIYMIAEGPVLMAMREQKGMAWEVYAMAPVNPNDHAWWQIRSEGDDIHFEVSADGVQFEPFATIEAPFALVPAHVVMASTNYEVLAMDIDVSVREFAMCSSP